VLFLVLSTALVKIQTFWNVTTYRLVVTDVSEKLTSSTGYSSARDWRWRQ